MFVLYLAAISDPHVPVPSALPPYSTPQVWSPSLHHSVVRALSSHTPHLSPQAFSSDPSPCLIALFQSSIPHVLSLTPLLQPYMNTKFTRLCAQAHFGLPVSLLLYLSMIHGSSSFAVFHFTPSAHSTRYSHPPRQLAVIPPYEEISLPPVVLPFAGPCRRLCSHTVRFCPAIAPPACAQLASSTSYAARRPACRAVFC